MSRSREVVEALEKVTAEILVLWNEAADRDENFPFKQAYQLAVNFCEKNQVPLADIVLNIVPNKPTFCALNLLQLAIYLKNAEAVQLVLSAKTPWSTISRQVTHPSGYTLMHFCSRAVYDDSAALATTGGESFRNEALIQIAKILSDTSAPDRLSLDMGSYYKSDDDVENPGHIACRHGALDLAFFFYRFDENIFERKQKGMIPCVNGSPHIHKGYELLKSMLQKRDGKTVAEVIKETYRLLPDFLKDHAPEPRSEEKKPASLAVPLDESQQGDDEAYSKESRKVKWCEFKFRNSLPGNENAEAKEPKEERQEPAAHWEIVVAPPEEKSREDVNDGNETDESENNNSAKRIKISGQRGLTC